MGLVSGQPKAIKELRIVSELIAFRHLYKEWGQYPPKGLLFSGPPGTGKTFAAKCMANETNAGFFVIPYTEIASTLVDGSVEALSELQNSLLHYSLRAPIIIFLDEVESFIPDRSKTFHETEVRKTNFILQWMDGFDDQVNITFIGATNNIKLVDKAALRPGRFKQINFSYLKGIDIQKCFEANSKLINKSIKIKVDWDKAASILKKSKVNISGAYIKEIINLAVFTKAKISVAKINQKIKHCKKPPKREISKHMTVDKFIATDDIINAIEKFAEDEIVVTKIGFNR